MFEKSASAPEGDVQLSTPYGDYVFTDKTPVEVDPQLVAELLSHPYLQHVHQASPAEGGE